MGPERGRFGAPKAPFPKPPSGYFVKGNAGEGQHKHRLAASIRVDRSLVDAGEAVDAFGLG